MLVKTIPGGPLRHHNRGRTAIHEVSHWNGLLHTFEGELFSPDIEDDVMSDTPQVSVPTDGCSACQDSWPDSPCVDPVHNFMDYFL
ncbi:hypothetical protein BDW66DRAFT_145036 [Aspergillus desertorum]